MNAKFKLAFYAGLIGCMVALASGFYATYHAPGIPTPRAVAPTNVMVLSNPPAARVVEAAEDITARQSSPRMGRLVAYGLGMFFTLVGLALLLGNDVSRFLANRMEDFVFNDDLEGVKDPEYEEAERVWASGQHLEAIQLMRDYLKRHPREQYVALRIAEVYETDRHNYLAAALEYEEVLRKRLPPERWGWAAIHLANLYSGKLNKTEQATALLRRIVDEYGQTAAAKKARERLGIPEPVEAPLPAPEPEPQPEKSVPPPSNLPPGFRPK